MILAGEDQVQRDAIGAHPFRRQTAGFTGACIPCGGVECRGPWAPWLGRIVDRKSAMETRVVARADLTPEITLDASVVADGGAVAGTGVRKDSPALRDIRTPLRLSAGVQPGKKFVGGSLAQFRLWHTRHDKSIRAIVRAIGIVRVNVNEVVTRASVVFAEVQKCWAAKTFLERPVRPRPRGAMIGGPAQLRIGGISNEQVENAIHA